ncbi:MAG TPA: anion transporter, partial [Candidatus Paceibacterota bacterium]|nr:anion transporter [Candidatus Paceibacterota bacterium]
GVSTVLSNLVSNVPAVMLFSRIVPHLPDPGTSWLALAMSSTLAGNLTILGSVANMIVVESARGHIEVGFWDYAKFGLPITLLTTVGGMLVLLWVG